VFGAPSDGTLCRKVPSLANARTSEGTHVSRLAREIAVVVVVVVVVIVVVVVVVVISTTSEPRTNGRK
jgi:t-SNARE complex subunit (syntaxin)